MENNFKNIVILKNLPSNIIEEAIVVIKENKMAQKLEYIDKEEKHNFSSKKDGKKYVIKEAESILESYISNIEQEKKEKMNIKLKKKCTCFQIISIILVILLITSLV